MPNYAGSSVRITAVVKDYNGAFVTTAASATVTLLDSVGNWVFQNQNLTYDAAGVNPDGTTGHWFYDWTSSQVGGYTAKCTFSGSGFSVYQYGRVNVSPPKVVETGLEGFP